MFRKQEEGRAQGSRLPGKLPGPPGQEAELVRLCGQQSRGVHVVGAGSSDSAASVLLWGAYLP